MGEPTQHIDGRPPAGYDAELRLLDPALQRAARIGTAETVLDIGCGTGQTTRRAARTARQGSALGVDVAAPSIERARELARTEDLHNVSFTHADAQRHRFPPHGFDVAISRFGTMFFDDPVVAFANIGRALRPGARLVMMVWQHRDHNEWSRAVTGAFGGSEALAALAPTAPDPFSLADPAALRALLEAAGFCDVAFTDVREPVYYGPDVAAALSWVRGFASISQALSRLDGPAANEALLRLRDALAAHAGADGVWFRSRAWVVTARRP